MKQSYVKSFWMLVMSCLIALNANDLLAAEADDLPMDDRIKILRYDANDIFTIYTLYGYQTNIEFSRGEVIRTISIGDRSLWQVVPSGHRIFIRPMDDNVTTNMTVITSRYTYQFDLKSGRGSLRSNPNMVYVARFTYPEKEMQKEIPSAVVPSVAAAPLSPITLPSGSDPAPVTKPMVVMPPAAPMKTIDVQIPSVPAALNNYRYTYTGVDALAPSEIYDDGTKTVMRFANPPASQPRLFVMRDGKPVPVAFTLEGEVMTVNSVYSQLLLDYGSGVNGQVNIYNEALMPAGM